MSLRDRPRAITVTTKARPARGPHWARPAIPLAVTLTAVLLSTSPLSTPEARGQEVTLVEWVETNDFDAEDRIALGYPPPIPVNTPLPFDGFRTYEGLRARHMDLAGSTPWVHGHIIGQTRAGRDIWAYRLGDEDTTTPWGLPEAATLTNGGIHAREWQSPEVVTGILERLATQPADAHLLDYLREQVNMVVIPVLNVDGFLQTQRTPTLNFLGADPSFPDFWPRDGRMRRKNMLGVDEDLETRSDHLLGVDLNRNNPPYWNSTGGNGSSDDETSLIHHGSFAQSEPETRALDMAAALGPASELRLYTDVHSYSMVHFWGRNGNSRLAVQTEQVLQTFTDHHRAFPAGKWYAFDSRFQVPLNSGIGTTDEYFTEEYEVPSWTLEVEPSGGQEFHAPLPGGGADYGGAGVNGHDGFILPESEIRRVREQLAETFTTVFYRQAGPPHIQSVRLFDADSGALVAEQDWDPVDARTRARHLQQLQPIELERDYLLWVGFSKPMRWLQDGEVALFPGADADTLTTEISAPIGIRELDVVLDDVPLMAMEPGPAPEGYRFYRTDALMTAIRLPATQNNRDRLAQGNEFSLRFWTKDMTGLGLDSDPSTVAHWRFGSWASYEDGNGSPSDVGGPDATMTLQVTGEAQPDPFTIEPGIAAAWFDPARTGEGFIIEILTGGRAVLYWFTYDDEGAQDWYLASGTVSGNQLRFPELLRFSGGVFGPGFDPDDVSFEPVGSATFTWSGCNDGTMAWHIGNRRGRQALARITRIQGLDCGIPLLRPIRQEAQYSGAWYDPDRTGEGFTIAILEDNRAVAYWFTYGPDGERRWVFGTGTLTDGSWVFPDMITTAGPRFGAAYDPADFEELRWGRLELDLSCEGGEARYESTEAGFGSGIFPLVQLTSMDGPACPPPSG